MSSVLVPRCGAAAEQGVEASGTPLELRTSTVPCVLSSDEEGEDHSPPS